jgi:hypothetical protein
MDERHRIDLSLSEYEADQFVILPERDGDRVVRRLARAVPRTGTAPAAE